jgi:hypothetical protein
LQNGMEPVSVPPADHAIDTKADISIYSGRFAPSDHESQAVKNFRILSPWDHFMDMHLLGHSAGPLPRTHMYLGHSN